MINKLILGTAQFGLNYGINNHAGLLEQDDIISILEQASILGIKYLDTAADYGKAEERIGLYNNKNSNPFLIFTKFSKKKYLSWEESLRNSLHLLNTPIVDTVLFHSFDDYFSIKDNLDEIIKIGKDKYFNKIGVSIYTNEELEYIIKDSRVETVQLPFNMLDNDNQRGRILYTAKKMGKTVLARSVFLQGIFFMKKEQLPPQLKELDIYTNYINRLSSQNNIPIQDIALQYALSKDYIDGVLIGIDSEDQLQQNIQAINSIIPKDIFERIDRIEVKNIELLNPTRW